MTDTDVNSRGEVQYDLSSLMAINFGNYRSSQDIRQESLKPAWHAFQNNIESIRLMAGLPQTIVNAAIAHLLPLVQATHNVLGKPVMEDHELAPNREAISAEYDRIVNGFLDDRRNVWFAFSGDLANYNNRNLVNSPLTRPGFVSLLEAIVIGAWTAFESLTTELFIAAVNLRPEILRVFDKKQIQIGNLLDSGDDMNWNGRFGELLYLFVRLDSFASKREAYDRAFKDERIIEAITSPKAEAALLVRNLLIHDSGIATTDFVKQVAKFELSPWKIAKVGLRVPLHGHNVAGLAEDLIECANELVMAIDDWLELPARRASKSQDQDR